MNYDPSDAVKHVVHDYLYLVSAGTDTQKSLPHPLNHYAERTFLVHYRAFADFFSGKNDARDLHARDFTRKPFARKLPTWENFHDHIDKHLMHLTISRIKNTIPWTGEPSKPMLDEFRIVWAEFLEELKDDLKPLFNQEIERNRGGFKDYKI
ncbi:MAG: hypothetical protein ACLQU1_36815 [Bryobacteraceae bacterium]